jgi:hypothetical protein
MRRRPLTHQKQPVSPYKQILLEFLSGRNNINKVYRKLRQTGLPGLAYKQKTVDAIKYLERAGLVVDVSGLKRHKSGKEQQKELTPLGHELAELIENIGNYDRSYSELKAAYREHFSFQSKPKDNTVLANILRSRRWTEQEIGYYLINQKTWPHGDYGFQYKSPWTIINIVLAKYSILVADYKPNQIAKDIMNKLLLDVIVGHLSSIFENVTTIQRQSMLENATNKTFNDISDVNGIFDYHFMNKHVEDVLLATFSVLKPPREKIVKEIKQINYAIPISESFENNEKTINHHRQMIGLLEKVLAKLP